MSNYQYKTGAAWAGSKHTVIAGEAKTKAPMGKWKHLVWPERAVPTEKELTRFRTLGLIEGATPLLLLDSPVSEALCLCVVDVDYAPAIPEVRGWLKTLGIEDTLEVQTGREGGGLHFYFLRSAQHVKGYRSKTAIPLFGTYFDSVGKEKGKVDFKAYNSYTVCPGAVHKSGLVYKATYKGNPVPALEPLLASLPVMPLKAWCDAAQQDVARNQTQTPSKVAQDWSTSTLEWGEVVSYGQERQPCPWCRRGGNRILQWDMQKGTAYCYFERVKRAMTLATPKQKGSSLSLVDTILRGIPLGKEGQVSVGAAEVAGGLLENLNPIPEPIVLDLDDITLFEEGHPLKEQELKASIAKKLLKGRFGAEVPFFISCPDTPTLSTGYDRGFSETRSSSCKSFRCPTCGPRMLEALKCAILGQAFEEAFGRVENALQPGFLDHWEGSKRLAYIYILINRLNVFNDQKVDHNQHVRVRTALLYRPSNLHCATRQILNKHEKISDGQLRWFGVQVNPLEIAYILFINPQNMPKAPEALWYLFDETAPTFGRFEDLIEDVFNQISIQAWEDAVRRGEVARIRLLVGPSDLTAKVNALYDWLTAHKPKKAQVSPDHLRYTIATNKPEEVRVVVETALQEALVLETTPKDLRAGILRQTAKLPASPGPAMRDAVKAGIVNTAAGKRKAKKLAINSDGSIL